MATSIKVRFTLTGANINPDNISHATGLAPTKTWRRGEQRASSALLWEHDGWMLSTNEEMTLDLVTEIQKLLQQLKGHTKQINHVRLVGIDRNSSPEAAYAYDAFGRRVLKDPASSSATHFVYDPGIIGSRFWSVSSRILMGSPILVLRLTLRLTLGGKSEVCREDDLSEGAGVTEVPSVA